MVLMHFKTLNGVGHCHANCDLDSVLDDGDINNPTAFQYKRIYRRRKIRIRRLKRRGMVNDQHFSPFQVEQLEQLYL